LAEDEERQFLVSYLEERFGISASSFELYHFFRRKKSWIILKKSSHLESVTGLKIKRLGIKAFRRVGKRYVKPTTRFIQCFGGLAGRCLLDLDRTMLRQILNEGSVPMNLGIEPGYVILLLEGNLVLGLGLYVRERISLEISRRDLRDSMAP